MRAVHPRRTALLAATVIYVVGTASAVGQSPFPGIRPATPPANESVTTVNLYDIDIPEGFLPGGEILALFLRGTWDQGGTMDIPAGAYAPGAEVDYIAAGSIKVQIDGSVFIARGEPGQPPGRLTRVKRGATLTLHQGDVVLYQLDAAQHGSTVGDTRATVLSFLIGSNDPPEDPQANQELDNVVYEQLGGLDAGAWSSTAARPLRISLERSLLAAGGRVPPYTVPEDTAELLAIEAGVMEVGLDFDGDGAPESWTPLQRHQPVNELLGLIRELRAGTEPLAEIPEELTGLGPKAGDALVYLTLRVGGGEANPSTPET